MGKRKKKTNKLTGASSKENKNEKKDKEENLINDQKFTVDDLLKKVEEYMESFNFELAERFCTRAIELSPDNHQALRMAASVYLEIGKVDEAVGCLRHAIDIEPNDGFSKYMTLGELLEGEQAVECLKKGIEIMINEKEAREKENVSDSAAECTKTEEITNRDISNAFCSLAEIYLTDCCFEEDAENSCKFYCEKAVEQDPDNPDAYQVMANFLLSEQKNEDAKEMLLKGLNLWHGCDDSHVKNTKLPPYESRLSLSKMLIEVEEFDNACSVLEELLSEDDEVVQVWYLFGWIHYLKQQDYTSVVYYLEMAQKLFTQTECDDEPLLEHINELLSEVREKTSNGGENFNGDEENGDGDAENGDIEEDNELKSMDTTE